MRTMPVATSIVMEMVSLAWRRAVSFRLGAACPFPNCRGVIIGLAIADLRKMTGTCRTGKRGRALDQFHSGMVASNQHVPARLFDCPDTPDRGRQPRMLSRRTLLAASSATVLAAAGR